MRRFDLVEELVDRRELLAASDERRGLRIAHADLGATSAQIVLRGAACV